MHIFTYIAPDCPPRPSVPKCVFSTKIRAVFNVTVNLCVMQPTARGFRSFCQSEFLSDAANPSQIPCLFKRSSQQSPQIAPAKCVSGSTLTFYAANPSQIPCLFPRQAHLAVTTTNSWRPVQLQTRYAQFLTKRVSPRTKRLGCQRWHTAERLVKAWRWFNMHCGAWKRSSIEHHQ